MALLNRIIRASVLLAPQPAEQPVYTNIGRMVTDWDTNETWWDNANTGWDNNVILVQGKPIEVDA